MLLLIFVSMKLIYAKEGETLQSTARNMTAKVQNTAVIQVEDEVRQFDDKGNEIVMYVKL